MARPSGSRNPDHDAKRAEMLAAIRRHLASPDGRLSSYRDLARACGVSVPTLSHYFGKREELVAALFADALELGRPYLDRVARPDGPFEASITSLVQEIGAAFGGALSGFNATGLLEGLHHPVLGPVYLEASLEPVLSAVSRRLAAHAERGEMRDADPRASALILVSPILVAYLHQHDLGGAARWPMDLAGFLDLHAAGFLRAFAADPD